MSETVHIQPSEGDVWQHKTKDWLGFRIAHVIGDLVLTEALEYGAVVGRIWLVRAKFTDLAERYERVYAGAKSAGSDRDVPR